jgi:hypothetical protein
MTLRMIAARCRLSHARRRVDERFPLDSAFDYCSSNTDTWQETFHSKGTPNTIESCGYIDDWCWSTLNIRVELELEIEFETCLGMLVDAMRVKR